MVKTNTINKVVNGQIADADEVNQIVENAGAEGGIIPYSASDQNRETDGSVTMGSVTYPWGDINVSKDSYLREIETLSSTVSASVLFSLLRNFISQKDTPASYSGAANKFLQVNAAANGIQFTTTPNEGIHVDSWHGSDEQTTNVITRYTGTDLLYGTNSKAVEYDIYGVYGATYRIFMRSKFIKVAGVDTLKVWARLWTGNVNNQGSFKYDINSGTDVEIATGASTSPAWRSGTLDVSGLVDGTEYDVEISIKDDGNQKAYCSAFVVLGQT